MVAARIAMRASAPQVYDGRWSDNSGTSRTVSSGRIGGVGGRGSGRSVRRAVAASRAPSPAAASRRSPSRPASSTVRMPGGRKSRSAPRSVDLPTCRASAATMTGTRPSMRTHSVAASSASSVPARSSSTMERGVGGTWRTAHRPRAGEVSAKGISERSDGGSPFGAASVRPTPGSVKRFGARPRHHARCVEHPVSIHGPVIGSAYHRCHGRSTSSRSPPTASPTSRRSSTRVATRSGAGAPTSGCAGGTGRTRRPARTASSSRRRRKEQDHAPGLVAYEDDAVVGWVSLGPREDYERLAFSKVLAPLDDKAGLVDRVLRRRAEVARPGCRRRACSTRPSTTPATTARPPSRPTRSRSPDGERIPSANAFHGTLGDVRAGRVQGRRAAPGQPERHSAPDRAQDDPGHAPSTTRRIGSTARPYVICRGPTSSSDEVDTARPERLDCRLACKSHALV